MTEPHNARRDAPVICKNCGRKVTRKMRGQRYCSPKCCDRGRGRTRKVLVGGDTGAPGTPPKKDSENRFLRGAKSGSSIPINLLGGADFRPWLAPSRLDRATRAKICRAEIAEPPADVWVAV
jgi:hypothetical protein